MLTVTLDTDILDELGLSAIQAAAYGLPFVFAPSTVSEREQAGSSFVPPSPGHLGSAQYGEPIYETLIADESPLDMSVAAANDTPFEEIIRVISRRTFPPLGKRDNLTKGQKHQLRDAIILEAHWRTKRDILVSKNKQAFGEKGSLSRRELESLCSTRIMTVDEFCAYCQELRSAAPDADRGGVAH